MLQLLPAFNYAPLAIVAFVVWLLLVVCVLVLVRGVR